MTIKSLLLGSAAALVAVSGARAADAVVIPEPEAVEYVRVCDAAGAGYFYIPGGETCLKIGGYVQFEVKADEGGRNDFAYTTESVLEVSSWTDSEYGAVKTYIKIQGYVDDNVGNYAIKMDRATLSIGGLTMGWTNTFMDFADGAGAADDDLFGNGPGEANSISYVADFSGGSFGIQIVDDADGDYTPDILAMASFTAGAATIKAVGAYNESQDAFSAKLQAEIAGFGAIVQYSSDPFADYNAVREWVIGANYGFDATDKLNLNLGAAYAFSDSNGGDLYLVGAEAAYMLTDTFKVSARARIGSNDYWDARVRFKASF